MKVFVLFFKNESGAPAIEYALVAALVALAGILAFTALGNTVTTAFAEITNIYCTAVGSEFELTEDGGGSCI